LPCLAIVGCGCTSFQTGDLSSQQYMPIKDASGQSKAVLLKRNLADEEIDIF
jgi:hypothetical protein